MRIFYSLYIHLQKKIILARTLRIKETILYSDLNEISKCWRFFSLLGGFILKNNKNEPLILSALGYVIVAVFFLSFVGIYIFSNIVNLSMGWSEIPPALTLVLSLICSTPLFLPLLWGRLTKLRFFEFEIALSDVAKEVSQSLPNELKDSKRLQLGASLTPEIIDQIKNALRTSATAELVEVNLGYGRTWLATRLYLLANICIDYTDTKQFILLEHADGLERSFLGMIPPKVIKRLLAAEYPVLERAYREAGLQLSAFRNERNTSSSEELEWIVQNFGNYLQQLASGEEGELKSPGTKEWVTKELLIKHFSFDNFAQSVEWDNTSITPLLLYRIVKNPFQYVPLTQNRLLIKIVDRFELSTKIADLFLKQRLD